MSYEHEWLDLIDISGPFLAVPVLKNTLEQGLLQLEPQKKKDIRQAYDEWREALDEDDPNIGKFHTAWIDLVLKQILELDDDGSGDVLKPAAELPEQLTCDVLEHGVTLQPDYAVIDSQRPEAPLMLIRIYAPEVDLNEAVKGDGWASTPADRMVHLCRDTGTRLGIVTNGEQWMFVDAPVGAITSFATWYARLWSQEPETLQAFITLFGVRRFFLDQSEQLPALLDQSLQYQDEVTDALGGQVRRAVEVLIQALDKANIDDDGKLLAGIDPRELYEAGLTVMMRLVFLLSAEERDLLLLGDERYDINYAVSTLRMQLRAESDEILDRRWDAWSRLLAIFRAVYGGIEHETLRMPALGGSLFDPDRFPFLEGRAKDSNWKEEAAQPLPINNHTVLLLLDAIQLYQGRALSYRGLDIEQLGYVYEGLLDHTVKRGKEVTLELDATKNAKRPWVTLNELELAKEKNTKALEDLLKDRMGSSISRVRNDLNKEVSEEQSERLLTSCQNDSDLRNQLKPFFNLIRLDSWDYPLVYPEHSFMVTTGDDRRQTGSHYTPVSLTEAIVRETLEPVVYVGPAEGKPREEWQLKSPAELLDLKICDPAMGSGAFLVQVCRWLGERVVESWVRAEASGKRVDVDGQVSDDETNAEPLPKDLEERAVIARRLIAERCIYGVDLNPLAVELAKLSVWLVTLAKGRPFGFLDHNLKQGDSLLGLRRLEHLTELSLNPSGSRQARLFGQSIQTAVDNALKLRRRLRNTLIRDIHDVEQMATLDAQARSELQLPECIANALYGSVFAISNASELEGRLDSLAVLADQAVRGDGDSRKTLVSMADLDLAIEAPNGSSRQPFHWPLEFPEIFGGMKGGFDAVVSNPPYLGGRKIRATLGGAYLKYLTCILIPGSSGNADLCAFFLRRIATLVRDESMLGMVASSSISEGDSREVGLQPLVDSDYIIVRASNKMTWPGKANVTVSPIWIYRGNWAADKRLNESSVANINSYLVDSTAENIEPYKLKANKTLSYQGSIPLGKGFVISDEERVKLVSKDRKNREVILPYLVGKELNIDPSYAASKWIINFFDWPLDRMSAPEGYKGKVASDYPECLAIVKNRVYPERTRKKPNGDFALRKPLPQKWWIYGDKRPALYSKLKTVKWALAIATGATKYVAFGRVQGQHVYSHSIVIVPSDDWELAAALASNIHEVWARRYGSYNLLLLRYTPTDIFDTFPFPQITDGLREIGRRYYCHREEVMRSRNEGLTKIYNRFHDKVEVATDIEELRQLQNELDEELCDAYGWDIEPLRHGFHQTEQGERYTISAGDRDNVLRKTLELNHRRYEEQAADSLHASQKAKKPSISNPQPEMGAKKQRSLDFAVESSKRKTDS